MLLELIVHMNIELVEYQANLRTLKNINQISQPYQYSKCVATQTVSYTHCLSDAKWFSCNVLFYHGPHKLQYMYLSHTSILL